MAAQSSSDPLDTPLFIAAPDGSPVPFTLGFMDMIMFSSLDTVIIYAAQLGASIVLLITLLLLTKPDKRFSPIFVLNGLSLLINFIRLTLKCLEYTGPVNEIYTVITGDFSAIPMSALYVSVAAGTLTFLLLVAAEVSLALQVQVVCIDLRPLYRRAVFCVSCIIGLVAIGFKFVYLVRNNQTILELVDQSQLDVLEAESLNATAVSIFYFSAVFITKLGFAIRRRRNLGMQAWGPMQILFTMGCQTLVVPAIFVIVQYCDDDLPDMQSNVLTVVALFLPLSSIWAASTIEGEDHGVPALDTRSNFSSGATFPASASTSTLLKNRRTTPTSSLGRPASTLDGSPAPAYTQHTAAHAGIELV